MFSIAAISVGSSIFFTFALITISVLVLLLLRRFLTLRATPAYLSIPVFLALALPASVVLLVPIDLASSSRDGGGPKAIWLPERLLLVSWRIAYWLIFVLTWAILPLLGEYIDSGYRDTRSRIQYSVRSNARYQLIVLGCATVGLIYISIQNGFEFSTIKALVMALAYVWGLVLAIYLMGHGLVSIPRTLFRNASASGRLRRLQAYAPLLHDRLMDATNDLESLEAQVAQLQLRKTGTARDFQDWIEELAETSTPPELRSGFLEPNSSSGSIPAVITERYLADLTRRLQRARHRKARFVDEWDRLILTAADLQAIINSSASKKLEFSHHSQRSNSSFTQLKLLPPYLRYQLYVNVYPNLRLVLGALFAAASVCVVWSELVKSIAPRLSVVTLSVVSYRKGPAPVGFGRQVIASMWLLYMCSAALVGVNDAKVWGNRALVRRNTYGESACWYAGLVARLTVPIAYNFLTFLPRDVQESTTFYRFLGQWIVLTPLGQGFDYFFPVFILVPIGATLFNLYSRVRNICGFGLLEEEDDDLENNPSGYGIGGWREGRELIERELNGLGSLGLSARNGRSPRPSANMDGSTQAFSSSRTPLSETTRPSRSTRGAVATSSAIEEDVEENFFESFAHRVRNTIETASRPQWLQGDSFQLPRWMSNDGSNDGNSGLARWFGGRPANGGVRI
ncbi:LMBR1 domain-containing protein [Aspergillus lucknowensis]|uniref:LMBR1 domain protein n=1 Tax=Aspergillus lucknowensis TaxID=176173 RepID=A0ABR4LQ91_9EURO